MVVVVVEVERVESLKRKVPTVHHVLLMLLLLLHETFVATFSTLATKQAILLVIGLQKRRAHKTCAVVVAIVVVVVFVVVFFVIVFVAVVVGVIVVAVLFTAQQGVVGTSASRAIKKQDGNVNKHRDHVSRHHRHNYFRKRELLLVPTSGQKSSSFFRLRLVFSGLDDVIILVVKQAM